MLKIAICDDNVPLCGQVEEMLSKVQQEIGERLEVDIYFRAEQLEHAWSEGQMYDLVFLDVELPGQTGIALAHKIREVWDDYLVQIVYSTASSQYMPEAFTTQLLGFLLKPLTYSQVLLMVNKAQRIKLERDACFTYTVQRVTRRIFCREIQYIRVQASTDE